MTNEKIMSQAGEFVMKMKKGGLQTNLEPSETRKYDERPLYQNKANDPAEIGYGRPAIPWSTDVILKSAKEHRQPSESPLKRWFLEEERKKIAQKVQDDKISPLENKTES